MSDPVTMPLNCRHCGGAIEVAFTTLDHSTTQTVRFDCPYCGEPREIQAGGNVLFVAMRQPGEGPETKH